ncbi:CPBP family intramembrane glutamic endopeptidase [Actinomadura xylanilytica]|uniref:CPBP family intramembrane glutamic endopeptidase n=1 Tax=Actinomadura xylanilytica TaxID=887459 RepID=UPI00255AC932|nr:CPBP family intramembrane glutamic endopeptidase [Actinomadura xylanilytica]MDL4772092.1 CPBP family intramembrane metalloprotease [Actinomadura xylanilytica]
MARTEVHRWWRPLVGSLAVVVVGFAAIIMLMVVLLVAVAVVTGRAPVSGSDDALFTDPTADLAFNLASLAVFLPVVLGAAWLVQRRSPGTLSSVAGRLRLRWMLVCCGVAIGFCAVSFGASWLAGTLMNDTSGADEHWVGWGDFAGPALVIILLVPFQSAAEEYVFRGWIIQALGACTLETRRGKVARAFGVVFRTPWPGIVVGAALFTSGHGYTGWGMLDIFFFGALSGWLAVRSGGLEASIALHVFNNLMAFLLPAAVGTLDIEQGGVPWQYVLADVLPMLLYAAVIVWLMRRMRIRTVTEGHVPATAALVDAPAGVPGDASADTPPAPYDHAGPGAPYAPYAPYSPYSSYASDAPSLPDTPTGSNGALNGDR